MPNRHGWCVLAYVALIFAGSGVLRTWQRELSLLMCGAYKPALNLLVILGLLGAIHAAMPWRSLWRSRLRWAFAAIVLAYGWIVGVWLEIAEERIHLVQYGLLAWLWTGAFARWPSATHRHLAALALTILAGIADELIQWWRPNRVGKVRDVVLNTLAAILAQSLLWIREQLLAHNTPAPPDPPGSGRVV